MNYWCKEHLPNLQDVETRRLKGPRAQFTEYIQKNVALYQFRNGIPLTTAAAANFTRGELATALRKNPYMVNIILAGYDKETGPSLYYIDYIASLHKLDKAAFGYGSYFASP
ncbi:Proteasome subunit beta type-2-B [Sesamum angolense]|uniref:Proteasome subunit beta type-2-B n=1 Tax=Sesamum angolense TaxID=2727404 RepID=A0AAE1W5N3_9LAMI|nr:Proteasome subunit beta type-2-B [Sesamum angolense]